MTDIDDFIKEGQIYREERSKERYDSLRGRRGKELELWKRWDENGRKPEHLEPLLNSIQPMIQRETTKRLNGLGGSIPRAALEGALQIAAVRAIENYDPNYVGKTGRPAQLSTHVHNGFMAVTTFIAKHRNQKRMPKDKVERYAPLNNAKAAFENEFGRTPTTDELHALLPGWRRKDIEELEHGFAPEAFSGMGVELEHDPGSPSSYHWGAVQLVRSKLNDDEKRFADMHYPPVGKRQMSVEQIARAMNIPAHKAYRIRSKVDKLIAPFVKGE